MMSTTVVVCIAVAALASRVWRAEAADRSTVVHGWHPMLHARRRTRLEAAEGGQRSATDENWESKGSR